MAEARTRPDRRSAGGLLTLPEVLRGATAEGYAVGAFGVWSSDTVEAVIETAEALRSPVILVAGPVEFALTPPRLLAAVAEAIAANCSIPVCLQLDHGPDLELAVACIEAGFPSVMIDGSKLPLEENIALTREVVRIARASGVSVEGEVGALGKTAAHSVEGDGEQALTDPTEAARFVAETEVDALAVSIGNAHGLYASAPKLDYERLAEIARVVDIPIVLHGGSGTSPSDITRLVAAGIRKVNVASDISAVFGRALGAYLSRNERSFVGAQALLEAKCAVSEVVRNWIGYVGSAGRV